MPFPFTSLLDSFDRADAATLGPNWTGSVIGSANQFQIISNQIAVTTSDSSNAYTSLPVGPNMEVWCSFPTIPVSPNAFTLYFVNNTTATMNGYAVRINPGSNVVTARRYDAGAGTQIGSFTQTLASGDSFGMTKIGELITAYYKVGAGAWNAIGSIADTRYTIFQGFLCMNANDTTSRFDNFGGGTIGADLLAGIHPYPEQKFGAL